MKLKPDRSPTPSPREGHKKLVRFVFGVAAACSLILQNGCSSEDEGDSGVRTHRQAQELEDWAIGTSYEVGDLVMFEGQWYRALQGHESQAGWTPAAVPALWEPYDVGQTVPSGSSPGTLSLPPTLEDVFVNNDCKETPERCCPTGSTTQSLTDGDDVLQILTDNQCVIAGHGRDTLYVQSNGPSALHLGPGDDTAMDGPGDDLIFGGDGRDTINGHGGTNLFAAGAGDDTIMAANGNNTVIPGSGVDTVSLGVGNDDVYIFDVCEVAAGDTIAAGTGHDRLHIPLPLEEMEALGLVVSGFEEIIVEDNRCMSDCTAPCPIILPPAGANIVHAQLLFPKGTDLNLAALSAVDLVSIEGTAITSADNALITAASGTASISSGSNVPTIIANGTANVEASATVRGDVLTANGASIDGGATVGGQVLDGQPLGPPDEYPLTMVFPPPSDGNLLIRSGRSQIAFPGDYGSLTVEGGGKLYLQTGRYTFENVAIESGGRLILETEEGEVTFHVEDSLSLLGDVSGLGIAEPELFVGYAAEGDVEVNGSFAGSLFAPSAKVAVTGGTHEAFFYGKEVHLDGEATLSVTENPWVFTVNDDGGTQAPPVTSDVNGGVLRATESEPGTLTIDGGFEFTLPPNLRVEYGNAGNLPATLTFTTDAGDVVTCDYRGGAPVASPVTLMDIALGRFFEFLACSNGASPGSTFNVTSVSLTISGDPQQPGTGVTLGLGDSCEDILPDPVSAAQSREMIENFSWSDATRVPERTAEGRVALYYAYLYLESQEDFDNAQRLLIHTQSLPLFASEMEMYDGKCGTVGLEGDGEGVFVFAVMPGALYNALIDARTNSDIPADEREVFRAVILKQPPEGAANPDGSLSYDSLQGTNFLYMGLSELPDDEAIEQQIRGKGAVSKVISAIDFIAEAARDFVRETIIFIGTLDKLLYGSHHATIDLNIRNIDDRFASSTMTSGWGSVGREIAPDDVLVTLTTTVQRPTTLGIPVITAQRARTDKRGRARLNVPDRDKVKVVSLCIELKNDAARMTSFLTIDRTCNFKLTAEDMNDFRPEDVTVPFSWKSRPLMTMSEFTDSAEYMRQVMGFDPKRAWVLRGNWARAISPSGRAFAGCLRLGNIVADAAVFAAFGINPVVGTTLAVLSNNDIFIPPNDLHDSRGVTTHEYGHFALCMLSDVLGQPFDDVSRTFDTLTAGSIDNGDETRIINEAFADFFAYQVAGATNYFGPRDQSFSSNQVTRFPFQPPGLDENLTLDEWEDVIVDREYVAGSRQGWIVSVLQDLFDGHLKGGVNPTSGDSWELDAEDMLVNSTRSNGDFDAETVVLGGGQITRLTHNFFDKTNVFGAYNYDALEEAIVETMTRGGVDWCNQCAALVHHYEAGVSDFRKEELEACLTGRVAELLGPPPMPLEFLNGRTCEPCPPGTGMGLSGLCSACGADEVIDWAELSPSNCERLSFPESTSPTDLCPGTFIVEVQNADVGERLAVAGGALPDISDPTDCSASFLGVDVESGGLFAPLSTLATETRNGAPCVGQFCAGLPACDHGLSTLVNFPGPVNRVRVHARDSFPGTEVRLDASCVIR